MSNQVKVNTNLETIFNTIEKMTEGESNIDTKNKIAVLKDQLAEAEISGYCRKNLQGIIDSINPLFESALDESISNPHHNNIKAFAALTTSLTGVITALDKINEHGKRDEPVEVDPATKPLTAEDVMRLLNDEARKKRFKNMEGVEDAQIVED